MTGNAQQTATGPASTTDAIDPESLADEPGVESREATFTHEEADHCEAGAAGRAIVGVTDSEGVLLCVRDGGEHAILPTGIVDDWTAAAREAVGTLGVAVELDGIERVRRVDHEREDGTHLETTHHVVFRGVPNGGDDPDAGCAQPSIVCDDEWTARWVAEPPVDLDLDRDGDSVYDDIRLFLD